MFTKKHYDTIAMLLQRDEPQDVQSEAHATWERIVLSFSTYFEIDNPRFKKGLFHKACCELRKSH